jgi:hypothetical protein
MGRQRLLLQLRKLLLLVRDHGPWVCELAHSAPFGQPTAVPSCTGLCTIHVGWQVG